MSVIYKSVYAVGLLWTFITEIAAVVLKKLCLTAGLQRFECKLKN